MNVHGRKVLQQFQIGGKVSREQLVSQQDDHGAAHVDKVVEAALVGEERVPDAHDVGQFKFLRQQQGQPPAASERRSVTGHDRPLFRILAFPNLTN